MISLKILRNYYDFVLVNFLRLKKFNKNFILGQGNAFELSIGVDAGTISSGLIGYAQPHYHLIGQPAERPTNCISSLHRRKWLSLAMVECCLFRTLNFKRSFSTIHLYLISLIISFHDYLIKVHIEEIFFCSSAC